MSQLLHVIQIHTWKMQKKMPLKVPSAELTGLFCAVAYPRAHAVRKGPLHTRTKYKVNKL